MMKINLLHREIRLKLTILLKKSYLRKEYNEYGGSYCISYFQNLDLLFILLLLESNSIHSDTLYELRLQSFMEYSILLCLFCCS